MDSFFAARENMIRGQVLPNKITDKAIIEIIADIPRHSFVPEHFKSVSYSDDSILLGNNRYMIPPVAFARMLQEVRVKSDDVVLDVACGSGYSSAVLAGIAGRIIAIESDSNLASKANLILNRLEIGNVIVINSKLSEGHPEKAPYDVIFLNGAIDTVPHSLLDQLSEGGRLITVLNSSPYSGRAVLFRRIGGKTVKDDLFDLVLPVISDFQNDGD